MAEMIGSSDFNRILLRFLGPLQPVVFFFLTALAALSLVRAGLVVWQWDRVVAVDGFWSVIGLGIRMDTVLL